jgi:diacylglycerol kinase family enzyme
MGVGVKGFLLVNPRSGSADGDDLLRLGEEARRRGVGVHVLRRGDDAEALARGANAPALGVAGGDGSLAVVAAVAIDRGLPFVCVPFGTRNHFARDLGLNTDEPVAALDAFAGSERRVDVGRVNGRLFLNNVSLGLYGRLVHRREGRRFRGEGLASVRALRLAVQDRHPLPVAIDGESLAARVVLVANNDYALNLFSLGERPRLDEGKLHLYAACGLLPHAWLERAAERFLIDVDAPTLRAAIDGEPVELEPPLEFAIHARALRLLVASTPG